MRKASVRVHAAQTSAIYRLSFPAICALFAAYVLLHSQARGIVAGLLGTPSSVCYLCLDNWARVVGPVSALVLISVAVLAAWRCASWIAAGADEQLLVFGVFALALISVPSAAVGLIGYFVGLPLLRPPVGPLLACAVPAVLVPGVWLVRGWPSHAPRGRLLLFRPGGLVLSVGALGLLLQLATVAISLTHPTTSGDALSYHALLGVFMWREGNLGSFLERGPDFWALAHPGMAELWFGLLGVIGGEAFADLGQLPFALLAAVAVGTFARRLGLRRGSAGLAGGAFLLTPMAALQVAAQPNDVVGAALLMSTVALASAPVKQWGWGRLVTIGTGLGLMATAKLALLPAVAGIGLFIVIALVREAYCLKTYRHAAVRLIVVAGLFLLVVSPWWMRNVVRYGNPVYPAAIPVLGRGVFIGDLGRVDTSFVPSPAAWPLYPLLEAHDDRSGFGALVVVAMLPGLLYLLLRRPRAPLALFALATAFMLPAWWIVTLHEPRFLLGLIGLGFAFVPWALLAIPRGARRWGALVMAIAAVFSVLVTIDQGLLPLARQPIDRTAFYDQVWGVDPVAAADLPESEGLLLNTGYAPLDVPEYAAYYPLLGPTQSRLVVPVEGEPSTDALVSRMQAMHIRYAYVLAASDTRAEVEAKYDSRQFELVHASAIVPGEPSGARRHLYRLATPAEQSVATMRFLFRLR